MLHTKSSLALSAYSQASMTLQFLQISFKHLQMKPLLMRLAPLERYEKVNLPTVMSPF